MVQETYVPKEEHHPAKCSFCNTVLTFTIKDGKKVEDPQPDGKMHECAGRKDYFSPKAVAERAEAERKELERIEIAQGKREPPKKKKEGKT